MADTNIISSLLNLQSVAVKDKSGARSSTSADLFSSVMKSTSAKSPLAFDRQDVQPEIAQPRVSPTEAPVRGGDDSLSVRDTSRRTEPHRQDKKPRPADEDSQLTAEQQEILAALPESQAEAIQTLPSEEQSALLDLLAVDGELAELSPQLATLLEGARVKELHTLESLLSQFQASLAGAESGPAALEALENLLAQSGLSEKLQDAILAQLEGLVAEGRSFDGSVVGSQMAQLEQVVKKLSQVLSTSQSPTLAQVKSAIQAGDNPFGQSLADNSGVSMEVIGEEGGKTSIVKLQADKLLDGLMLQAGDKGRVVSEAAQLHNLFSARGESAADRSSVSMANLAQLAQQVSQSPGQVRVAPLQTQLGASFQAPNWGQAVNQKVIWLAQQGIKSAEIRLDPPDLGPLHVRITVSNEQTQVNFTSHHAVVREALDQNAYRLREMLAEQGMTQVDVGVSGEEPQMAGQNGEGGDHLTRGGGQAAPEEEGLAEETVISQVGLVDHYA